MADGRILAKRITRSKKVASLSSDTARMFYTWLIPYLDVEGRMESDPLLLKADIAPLLPHVTEKAICAILGELHASGLIVLYKIDQTDYLQLTKFDDNQPNLRKDREAASKIPGPTPESLRSNSGLPPDKLPSKLSKDKLREEKIKHLDSVFLTEGEFKKLEEDLGESLTKEAIEILNAYIMSSGKKYKSHYHTLIQWPAEKAREKQNQPVQGGGNGRYPNRNRIPEPISRETQEGIDRINRMARELFKGSPPDKAKTDA